MAASLALAHLAVPHHEARQAYVSVAVSIGVIREMAARGEMKRARGEISHWRHHRIARAAHRRRCAMAGAHREAFLYRALLSSNSASSARRARRRPRERDHQMQTGSMSQHK